MNGVGGRTIAEAKENLSYKEFLAWAYYRSRRGSLNSGLMVELSIAVLSALTANLANRNNKFSMWDFTQHFNKPEPKEVSIEEFFKAF